MKNKADSNAKAESNDKALVKIEGKWSEVFAKDEAKKRYKTRPEYYCCGADKDGNPCLIRVYLKIRCLGAAYFSAGKNEKHAEGCEYSKSDGKHVIHPLTNDISSIDMNEYFKKFSVPLIKKNIAPGPNKGGVVTPPKTDEEEEEEEDIEILGDNKLPKTLSLLYGLISNHVNTATPMANGMFPEELIVNNETFSDFFITPGKLDGKLAICVCFFKKFKNGVYENAPEINGRPAFTLVYPRSGSGNEAIHYCISFANKEVYEFFKKKYMGKNHFSPMLILAKWRLVPTTDGDLVYYANITSSRMLGRIKDPIKEDTEKNFLN